MVSFTQEQQDPTGGLTLDALMARQKEAALRQAQLSEPSQVNSTILGGLGTVAGQFFAGINRHRAEQQEAEGRDALAKALQTGFDPATGQLSQEAMGTVLALDPDMGMQFIGDAIRSRREQVRTVTGDEAKALGLDPARTWQVDYSGKASDITPTEGTQYRPMTPEEYKAFNIPVDPNTGQPSKPYRWNIKENKPEAIGGEPATSQPMSDWQNRDLGYYHGGSMANDSLTETGNDAILATMDTAFWKGLGDWSGSSVVSALANQQLSPQQQIALNDALNFAAAVNRKESGASLTEQEIAGTIARYIPQYGDSREAIEHKRRNRAEKLRSFTFGLSGRSELDAANKDLESQREQRRKEREAQGGEGGGEGGGGTTEPPPPENKPALDTQGRPYKPLPNGKNVTTKPNGALDASGMTVEEYRQWRRLNGV
jgi:hypothetical protein